MLPSTVFNHRCQYSVTSHFLWLNFKMKGRATSSARLFLCTDIHLRLEASLKSSLCVIRVNWRHFWPWGEFFFLDWRRKPKLSIEIVDGLWWGLYTRSCLLCPLDLPRGAACVRMIGEIGNRGISSVVPLKFIEWMSWDIWTNCVIVTGMRPLWGHVSDFAFHFIQVLN